MFYVQKRKKVRLKTVPKLQNPKRREREWKKGEGTSNPKRIHKAETKPGMKEKEKKKEKKKERKKEGENEVKLC